MRKEMNLKMNLKIYDMGNSDNEKLRSAKAINDLKLKAIDNGGYEKFKTQIINACEKHKEKYGIDLTPLKFQI